MLSDLSDLIEWRYKFMSFVLWDVPIKVNSFRSVDLESYRFEEKSLVFTLVEEDTEDIWIVSFESVCAFNITTEECSFNVKEYLPCYGGFFKAAESEWLTRLGKGKVAFLEGTYHFIICCYDEIIELVASERDVSFLKKS